MNYQKMLDKTDKLCRKNGIVSMPINKYDKKYFDYDGIYNGFRRFSIPHYPSIPEYITYGEKYNNQYGGINIFIDGYEYVFGEYRNEDVCKYSRYDLVYDKHQDLVVSTNKKEISKKEFKKALKRFVKRNKVND